MSVEETPVEPTKEQLALLERLAHRYFRAALESAVEATWKEVPKNGLGRMSVVTLVQIVDRVVKQESKRIGCL